ncbi:GntR family transcriptional regulator [Aurantimonas sp. VKM B-3413]|uniref:GntR family transcriptional regulator n=1 Tax=Aurantimonas sp. VKM B-3413 TaxID=2779401 RepID=UPI001E5E8C1C|nr:GntR family transcriptional regulator [Aurantimonas sp. VKM B-3413]MCB8840385.1 GntR family transcriptional regulator [Aurantimonas sp. VKM B-3413]
MTNRKHGSKAGKRTADRVYEATRQGILSGLIKPGERITEELLAERFGASRTPVRSALVRLAGDGFVEMTPRSGTIVKQRSAREIGEIYDVRALLESEAARLASERRDAADLARLKAVQGELDALAANGQESEARTEQLSILNRDFHQAILSASRNSTLADSAIRLMEIGFLINSYANFGPEEIERSLSDHRRLLVAIETRDAAWAEAIMRSHILGARNSLSEESDVLPTSSAQRRRKRD